MATSPTGINAPARGIVRTLAGYIVQQEGIDTQSIAHETPDQLGAIGWEEVYDHRYDLTLTAISSTSARTAPATDGDRISYDGKTWVVDSVAEAGTYNDHLKWSIRAHRYDNFPTQGGGS